MLFHLDDVDRIGTLGALLVEELVQFRDVHGLYQVVDFAQFGHFEVDECIEVAELLEFLDAQRVEFALGVARCRPTFGLPIIVTNPDLKFSFIRTPFPNYSYKFFSCINMSL